MPFWRKSRKNASFLSLEASFFKEVSQKSFVLELQSFVLELQSFIFEGSLAEKLRFGASKLHLWRKSRRKVSFLSFKASFLIFTSIESQVIWISHPVNLEPNDLQTNWISNRMALKTIESRSSWIWNQLNVITWITPHVNLKPLESQTNCNSIQLNLKPMEAQISWQPNPLNPKSFDNQITWNSNQLTTISNQWNLKSQSNWISNQWKFKTMESEINWLSNQLNSTPFPYPIGALWLETSATASCGRYVSCIKYTVIHCDTFLTILHITWVIEELEAGVAVVDAALSSSYAEVHADRLRMWQAEQRNQRTENAEKSHEIIMWNLMNMRPCYWNILKFKIH